MEKSLNKEEQIKIRKKIFLHIDGWAVIHTMYVLHEFGDLKILLDKREF